MKAIRVPVKAVKRVLVKCACEGPKSACEGRNLVMAIRVLVKAVGVFVKAVSTDRISVVYECTTEK